MSLVCAADCPKCASMDPDDVEVMGVVDVVLERMALVIAVAYVANIDPEIRHPAGMGIQPLSEKVAVMVVDTMSSLCRGEEPEVFERFNKAHGTPNNDAVEALPDWCVARASYGPAPEFPGQYRFEFAVQAKEST